MRASFLVPFSWLRTATLEDVILRLESMGERRSQRVGALESILETEVMKGF